MSLVRAGAWHPAAAAALAGALCQAGLRGLSGPPIIRFGAARFGRRASGPHAGPAAPLASIHEVPDRHEAAGISKDDSGGETPAGQIEVGLTYPEAMEAWGPPEIVREWRDLRGKGHRGDGPIRFLQQPAADRDDPNASRRFTELRELLDEWLRCELRDGRIVLSGVPVPVSTTGSELEELSLEALPLRPELSRVDVAISFFQSDRHSRVRITFDFAYHVRTGPPVTWPDGPQPSVLSWYLAAPRLRRLRVRQQDAPLVVDRQLAAIADTERPPATPPECAEVVQASKAKGQLAPHARYDPGLFDKEYVLACGDPRRCGGKTLRQHMIAFTQRSIKSRKEGRQPPGDDWVDAQLRRLRKHGHSEQIGKSEKPK